MPNDDEFEVPAHPYKRFFVYVITRDPNYMDAIQEFVDNSIDGATRESQEESFDDYNIDVLVDSEKVEVTDDCGGLPKQLAEDYAFRFGRPEEVPEDFQTTIGEFGIGMKRSIFKLGRKFLVESNPVNGPRFIIEEDLNEWLQEEEGGGYEAWTFTGEEVSEDDPRVELGDDNGTRILITQLVDDAREEFTKPLFIPELRERLTSDFQQFLNRDLTITLNRDPLSIIAYNIKRSEDIEPAHKNFKLYEDGSEVEVDILAGIGDSEPEDAGWYIYCNGRQVLDADKSDKTGWTGPQTELVELINDYEDDEDDSEYIPQFHGQYARFRGYVNFKSEDPGALPWNTQKTDLNTDTGVFRKTRQQMISTMRPIINFLNEVRQEQRNLDVDQTPLERAVNDADPVRVDELEDIPDQDFQRPESEEIDEEEATVNVSYSRPKTKVSELEGEFGVGSASAVGRRTFDYYWNKVYEGNDES